MKILVTGSAGFVGKNLVEALKIFAITKTVPVRRSRLTKYLNMMSIRIRLCSLILQGVRFCFQSRGSKQAKGRRRVYEGKFRLRLGAFGNS